MIIYSIGRGDHMKKNMHNFPEKIKLLRNNYGYTQSELARKLSLTRASINAWEMGLSAPSTPFIVELSKIFHVTTDYLLGLDDCITIRTDGLSEREISAILNIVEAFYERNIDE